MRRIATTSDTKRTSDCQQRVNSPRARRRVSCEETEGYEGTTSPCSDLGMASIPRLAVRGRKVTEYAAETHSRVFSPPALIESVTLDQRSPCRDCAQVPTIGVGCKVLWRAFSCTNPFVRVAVIRRTGFVSFLAVLTFLSPALPQTPSPNPCATATPAGSGIAALYPGDKNIASDPAVIFADDFESYTSPSQLTTKWDSAYHLPDIRIAAEPGNVFSGGKSLEFSLPISTSEVSNALVKRLSPEQDTVFIRAY